MSPPASYTWPLSAPALPPGSTAPSQPPIAHNTDYLGEGLSLLLQQYKGKPRMEALLKSYLLEVQAAEDALWAIYADRLLQNAGVFPLVVTISKVGVLGTMQFTYTILGGAAQGPITSTVAPFIWNVPNTPFFINFTDINYTSTAWNYTFDQGRVTPAGGAGDDIYTTPGDILAKLGKLVGQSSYGYNDMIYTVMILARIRVNRSESRRADLVYIAWLLTLFTPIQSLDMGLTGGAAFLMYSLGTFSFNPYLIVRLFLEPAIAAGVLIMFVWSKNSQANTIQFGSIYTVGFTSGPPTTNTGASAGQMFGSIYTVGFTSGPPPTNVGGGKLAGVIEVYGGP